MSKPQKYILHANDPGRATVLENALRFLSRLPANLPWEISIARHVKTRTPKQRKALFAAAYGPIMEYIGLQGEEDKKDLHRYFCGEYWGWKERTFGQPIPNRTTTKNEQGERDEISTIVALEFYAFIQQRAAETGIDVPDPDPFWREAKAA